MTNPKFPKSIIGNKILAKCDKAELNSMKEELHRKVAFINCSIESAEIDRENGEQVDLTWLKKAIYARQKTKEEISLVSEQMALRKKDPQWAGVCDRNGKRICIGDKVCFPDWNKPENKYEVIHLISIDRNCFALKNLQPEVKGYDVEHEMTTRLSEQCEVVVNE